MRRRRLPIASFFVLASCSSAAIISSPDAAYLANTRTVTFSDPDEALLASISGGGMTIDFSSLLRASTVGNNWATWGSPPDTEAATPRVLWSGLDDNFNPVLRVAFLLSSRVGSFGFEAEPGPTNLHVIQAQFFRRGVLQETISRAVDGNGGARLFAAEADGGSFFDSVTITSDADWAAGQFRFAPAVAVPEPRPGLVLAALAAVLIAISRRMRGTL